MTKAGGNCEVNVGEFSRVESNEKFDAFQCVIRWGNEGFVREAGTRGLRIIDFLRAGVDERMTQVVYGGPCNPGGVASFAVWDGNNSAALLAHG